MLDINGPEVRTVAAAAPEAGNPMYLALSADSTVLYAAHAQSPATVSAWQVAADSSTLSPLGTIRSSGGNVACHLSVHPSGRYLLTANYGSGTIAVHPINDDGSLEEASDVVHHDGRGPHPDRQSTSHIHMATTDPVIEDGRGHVLAVDLGTDTIRRYELDLDAGRLTPVDVIQLPPGSGPRHLVVAGAYAYVAGELDSSLTVVDLSSSPPAVVYTVTTHPDGGPEPSYPSAIRLSPDGRYCYVANRGPNTIATFAVDGSTVTPIGAVPAGGDYPWDMIAADQHLYVVNQRTSALTTFEIDPASGLPSPVGEPVDVAFPVCLLPAH